MDERKQEAAIIVQAGLIGVEIFYSYKGQWEL